MDTPPRPDIARRRLLKSIGGGLALIPLMQLFGCSREDPQAPVEPPETADAEDATPAEQPTAPAPDMPRLSEDDPAARALGYRHATSDVDQAAFPRHELDQKCSNCALYTGGGGDQWGGCDIFPGKLVNADGWCNAWAPKA